MENTDLRDLVFKRLYETSLRPDYRFGSIANTLGLNKYRLSADIECDLCDELSLLGKDCGIRSYGLDFYVFDGLLWVTVTMDLLNDAFRYFLSRLGIKITENKRMNLLKNEFLPSIRINAKLKPRLDIVAFDNGVLDLSDFSFHRPDERFHVIYRHQYKYLPKQACPKWKKFLREVLPDENSRLILQMFLGLGLIERGSVFNPYENKESSKVELCLILLGTGANGKSVIYQTAVGLFGGDRISGVDYDELTSSGDEGMRSRRLLRDAVFNWSSDSDANTFGRKRTGVFKRIVSGEPVTDRGIGENVSQNFHLPYLIFNLNELPYPNDTSLGFIRRLQFVSFDITIPPDKQNKNLANELVAEYSGIFNWVAEGARLIKKRKFIFPSSEGHRRQLLLSQLKVDPVLAWVNAYGIRPVPMAKQEIPSLITSTKIMESLTRFCDDNDVDCPDIRAVGRTLIKLHFMKKTANSCKKYTMFGINDKMLMKPFIIRNEDIDLGFDKEV